MMKNLDIRKNEYIKKRGINLNDLVSDAEFIINDKNYFIDIYGGHVPFWTAMIDWCENEFQDSRDRPMYRVIEKQIIIQALNNYDFTLMKENDHTSLYIALINVLNGSAYTLRKNRQIGGQNSRKITEEVTLNILSRFEELKILYSARYNNAHIKMLAEEFKLSATSIKKIIPKKSNSKRLT